MIMACPAFCNESRFDLLFSPETKTSKAMSGAAFPIICAAILEDVKTAMQNTSGLELKPKFGPENFWKVLWDVDASV